MVWLTLKMFKARPWLGSIFSPSEPSAIRLRLGTLFYVGRLTIGKLIVIPHPLLCHSEIETAAI